MDSRASFSLMEDFIEDVIPVKLQGNFLKPYKTNLPEKYTERILKIIRRYERKGFIDYNYSFKLSGDLNDLLQSGDLLINKRNFLDAFVLGRITLKESIQLITYSDDSAG